MANTKAEFQLTFPENLKKDTNLSTTDPLTFDALGDFIEERKRISRALEDGLATRLRVDYSDYANHVFFDSALQKFNIAKTRVLMKYPFNGTREEKDSFHLTGSGYDNYIFDQWPRHVGHLELDGTSQFVSASDADNKLLLGSSSLYVSVWTDPVISTENMVLQKAIKRDNYISFSDDFESGWTTTNASVSASSIAGPVEVSGATLVEDASVGAEHSIDIITNGGLAADNTYNISAWIKSANRSRVRVSCQGGANHIRANFDLNTGTLISLSGDDSAFGSTKIESFEDGWFRCSVEWVSTVPDGVATLQIQPLDDTESATYTGLSQDALYLFGAQFSRNPIINPPAYLSSSGSSNEERSGYELFFSGAIDPYIKFEMFSGSTTVSVSSPYETFTGSFHNIAAIYDNANDLASIYVDGVRRASSSAVLGAIDEPPYRLLVGSGTLQEVAIAPARVFDYYSGSIDEIRIAHTASELFHQKNYSRPIHAGGEFVTGSTKEPDYLKVYYPFNEGVVGTASIDQNIVDYSKTGLHAKIINYDSTVRVSGAVMLEDPGNPILYSFHSGVVAFTASAEIETTLYDNNNNNFIFNMIPEQLLIEDESADGLLASFTLGMARFFDEMKLFMDQFDNLRITNYDAIDETPDLFLPMLQRYFGWRVTDHYGDANPLSFFFGEDILASGSVGVSLFDIRNQFWRRILNNLPYLYKTKGKRHNLDAFFNVLGINRDNINLKEYGYLPGGSIQDDRILKDKPVAFLGIGTGSFGVTSGSFVKTNSAFSLDPSTGPSADLTVETMVQLPFVSASYSGTLSTGSLWQLTDTGDTTNMSLYWVRNSLLNETGKLVLSGTSVGGANTLFSSSDLDIFDGEFIHISAGKRSSDGFPFISLRSIEGCDITLSEDFTGSAAWDFGPTTSYDLIIGAGSGTFKVGDTQGFFGEVRLWDRALSGSELDDHALHFESVGICNATEEPHPLVGHWALNEEIVSNDLGAINGITDLSRNGVTATGSGFPANENAYQRFVREYNHLSPSIDLKWTENKIRVRSKTELTIDDVAQDTNEVSLEFNLVDALNEDISKIFSTFDVINNLVGSPVNKYRDEYQDLESLSRVYFQRLGDSLNFTRFFDLFQWFDKKLSTSIKQLLPTRVKFIGGEQVVESHFLERNRYGYKYPIFRTPKDPEVGEIVWTPQFSASCIEPIDGRVRNRDDDAPKILTDRLAYGFSPNPGLLVNFSGSGTYLLTGSLTVNGTEVNPSFVYAGKQATLTEWSGSDFGGPLEIGFGSLPVLLQGAPFLSLDDDSVFFSGAGAGYASVSSAEGDVGLNDIAIEIIAQGHTGSFAGVPYLISKETGLSGWSLATNASNQLVMRMGDGGGITSVSSGPLESDSFFHAMIFVNRDENSTSGVKIYINGEESGPGGDLSSKNVNLNGGINLGVHATTSGAGARMGRLVYAAMWNSLDWFQLGTPSPDEWEAIAKERFFKLCGVYPEATNGWNPIPAEYDEPGAPKFLELGRGQRGTNFWQQNVGKIMPVRSLYKVGGRWPRVTEHTAFDESANEPFAHFPTVIGYLSQTGSTNLLDNSADLSGTWSHLNCEAIFADNENVHTGSLSFVFGDDWSKSPVFGESIATGMIEFPADSGSLLHRQFSSSVLLQDGVEYMFSCYMKNALRDYGHLRVEEPTGAVTASFWIDRGGTLGVSSLVTKRVAEEQGMLEDPPGNDNPWVKCWYTFVANGTGVRGVSVGCSSISDNRAYVGADFGVAMWFWNPQIEVYRGVPPTPVVTTGSSASHGVSRLKFTGSNLNGGDTFLDPHGFKLEVDASAYASGSGGEYYVASLSRDGAADNRVAVKIRPLTPSENVREDDIVLISVSGSEVSEGSGSLYVVSGATNFARQPRAAAYAGTSSFQVNATFNSVIGDVELAIFGHDATVVNESNVARVVRNSGFNVGDLPSSLNTLEVGGNNSGSQRLEGVVNKVVFAPQLRQVPPSSLPEAVVSTVGAPQSGIAGIDGDCFCTPKSVYADGQETVDKHSHLPTAFSEWDENLLLWESGESGGSQRLFALNADSTGTLFVSTRSKMMDNTVVKFDPDGIPWGLVTGSNAGSIVRIPAAGEDPKRAPKVVCEITSTYTTNVSPGIMDFWIDPDTDKIFACGYRRASSEHYFNRKGGIGDGVLLTSSDHGHTWHSVLDWDGSVAISQSNGLTPDRLGFYSITGSNGKIFMCGCTGSGPGISDGNWIVVSSSDGGHFDTWGIADHFSSSANSINNGASDLFIENDILWCFGNAYSSSIGGTNDYTIARSSSDNGVTWKTAIHNSASANPDETPGFFANDFILLNAFFRTKANNYVVFLEGGAMISSSSPAGESGSWSHIKEDGYFNYPDMIWFYENAGLPSSIIKYSFGEDDPRAGNEYFFINDVVWFSPHDDDDPNIKADIDYKPIKTPNNVVLGNPLNDLWRYAGPWVTSSFAQPSYLDGVPKVDYGQWHSQYCDLRESTTHWARLWNHPHSASVFYRFGTDRSSSLVEFVERPTVNQRQQFSRRKVSGDTNSDINDANSGINFKNEFAKYLLTLKDRDNE